MIFSNIKQFFGKNKKIFYYLGFFIVVYILFSDNTFAADTIEQSKFDQTKATVVMFSEGILKGISVLLALITFLATIFLSPEWINGSLFGLNSYFKEVWILVSNLVYFAFAFILIWIAFMNIIGKSADQYQLKQALPKFIVGVLIVPFSWFLIQFILSISAILTVSAISLPFDTFDKFEGKLNEVMIPQKCTIDLMGIGKEEEKQASFIDCSKLPPIKLEDVMNGGKAIDSVYGIIAMYTYGILSFDTIGSIDKIDFASINNFGDLIIKILFDLLFVVVYSVLLITLGMVLMIRGIYIWIYTMISPVFGLMYFFDKKEGGEGFFGKFNVKEFIALAMVPVYTMLALSFGLLFIYVVGSGLTTSSVSESTVKISEGEGSKNSQVSIGGFILEIKGAAAKEQNVTNFLTKIGGGALGVIGSLILKVFGIVVLWGTVMAAMRSSEITKQITQPLHDFGAQVGKIVASAPGNTPIFGGQSMTSLGSAASNVSTSISGISSTKGAELAKKFMPQDPVLDKMRDVMKSVDVTSDKNKKTKAVEELLTIDIDWKNRSHVNKMITELEKIGFKDLNAEKLMETGGESGQLSRLLSEAGKGITDANLDASDEYRRLLDKIKGKTSTTLAGDTSKTERTLEDYTKFSPNEIVSDLKVKGENGSGELLLKQGEKVMEIVIKTGAKSTSDFNSLTIGDQEELAAVFKEFTGEQRDKTDDIFEKLGIGDGKMNYKEAIEKHINKQTK